LLPDFKAVETVEMKASKALALSVLVKPEVAEMLLINSFLFIL
jgi:hypothetical protein